ncbi:alpha/beta hydrolase [Streptomyces sp. NPDC046203]|uniref:alpha/beta hydrolase n=1 Tax=Streptomyces sp. NPDC046203 TaxID=3154602 RepID=UPI00340FA839
MRRFTRTLVAAALTATIVAGTAGWASGDSQRPVTGSPAGTAAWVAEGLPDPAHLTPHQVASYLDGLGERERRRLLREHPGVLGNLDGAPLALRYAANARTAQGRFEAGVRVLAYDPRGRGQAVFVLGDLAKAAHVAVIVPGSDTDADHLGPLLAKARALYEATGGSPVTSGAVTSRAAAGGEKAGDKRTGGKRTGDRPGGETAVVAWAGYTTPVGVGLDAATGTLAEAGAARLVRFTEGLRAVGAAEPALFCHSYGSVVCGLAARDVRATDLVAIASPGMRADDAAGLGTDARVWAAKDPDDWIDRVPNVEFAGLGHGADPASAAFGARPVPAADAHGHDGYFAPGTSSLRAFAAIAEGAAR